MSVSITQILAIIRAFELLWPLLERILGLFDDATRKKAEQIVKAEIIKKIAAA